MAGVLQVKRNRWNSALFLYFIPTVKLALELTRKALFTLPNITPAQPRIDPDCFYSIIVIDCYNKSKTSSNGAAEIKTQGRRETDRMVGRRGGLQSIPRDGETWLQAAHILGCWFHFPHSAQQREEERCDAPRRYATQAQLKLAAQVWCNQWCTRLFVFESALYITVSSQPISSSCCHARVNGKPIWNVLFAAALGFPLRECRDVRNLRLW